MAARMNPAHAQEHDRQDAAFAPSRRILAPHFEQRLQPHTDSLSPKASLYSPRAPTIVLRTTTVGA
jgi:hypothetical protein